MDEKTKASMLKYRKNARGQIQIDVAKGVKAKVKAYAASKGMSMSALIMQLLESEMQFDGFNKTWTDDTETERKAAEEEKARVIAAIRAQGKPPEVKR